MDEPKKRYRIKAECPDCGCGLIENFAPDVWREKYGENTKMVEVECKDCKKPLVAMVTEVEE